MEQHLKDLIATHLKANRLGKEIKKARGNIINAIKKNNSSDLEIEKLKYTGFAGALDKETAIFNELLKKLENNINDCSVSFNDRSFEITENSNSDSSSNISEKPSLDNDYSTINSKEENTCTSTKKDVHFEELYKDSMPLPNEHKTETVSVSPSKKRAERRRRARNNKQKNKNKHVLNNNTINNKQKMNENKPVLNNNKKGSKILNVRSGLYKYGGKGFEIFTGYRNQSRPIYSSTMLYCSETCNGNKNELKKYLIEYGKFNGAMIEEIIFKFRGYYERYALIKVRGDLKCIKKRIEKLNKAKGNGYSKIISILKRHQIISAKDVNNKLYVSNFDILERNSHKRFTDLFLKYGELMDDIRIGLDKYNNLYAIVYFRNVNDAKECIESELELEFDGKVLNISYSKF